MYHPREIFIACTVAILVIVTFALATSLSVHTLFAEIRCNDSGNPLERIYCFEGVITKIAQKSPRGAFNYITHLTEQDIIAECHYPGHLVGRQLLIGNEYNLEGAVRSCPTDCDYACVHGVFEAYTISYGDIDPQTTCRISDREGRLSAECIHGYGHFLVRHSITEPKDELHFCQDLQDEHATEWCISGMMMEHVQGSLDKGVEVFRTELPSLCSKDHTNPYMLDRCIKHAAHGMLLLTNYSRESAHEMCALLREDAERRLCAQYVDAIEDGRPLVL